MEYVIVPLIIIVVVFGIVGIGNIVTRTSNNDWHEGKDNQTTTDKASELPDIDVRGWATLPPRGTQEEAMQRFLARGGLKNNPFSKDE